MIAKDTTRRVIGMMVVQTGATICQYAAFALIRMLGGLVSAELDVSPGNLRLLAVFAIAAVWGANAGGATWGPNWRMPVVGGVMGVLSALCAASYVGTIGAACAGFVVVLNVFKGLCCRRVLNRISGVALTGWRRPDALYVYLLLVEAAVVLWTAR